MGYLNGSAVKNSSALQEMQEMWVQSLAWEDPLEKGMATHAGILAARSLTATVHRVAKSQAGLKRLSICFDVQRFWFLFFF